MQNGRQKDCNRPLAISTHQSGVKPHLFERIYQLDKYMRIFIMLCAVLDSASALDRFWREVWGLALEARARGGRLRAIPRRGAARHTDRLSE